MPSFNLDVYVDHHCVGHLRQTQDDHVEFTYKSGVDDRLCVSLTMLPSKGRSWKSRHLFPVFEVSLPEGALARTLAQSHGAADEWRILALIGPYLIGRVHLMPEGIPLTPQLHVENFEPWLKASTPYTRRCSMETHAPFSGVSGSFEKHLVTTYDGNTIAYWIAKSEDSSHPGLVFNEYHSMEVVRRMGLPVPDIRVSQDWMRLLIARFDMDANGANLGFEDMCSLMAPPTSLANKINGNVEGIVDTIRTFCNDPRQDLHRFFEQYLATMAMRNGDAHLKNFGLLYRDPKNVTLSPVYDMVTMAAYANRDPDCMDADDNPILPLGGTTQWPDHHAMQVFATQCHVSGKQFQQSIDRLRAAMLSTSADMLEIAHHHPRLQPMAKRMLQLWGCGLAMHEPDAGKQLHELASEVPGATYTPAPSPPFQGPWSTGSQAC